MAMACAPLLLHFTLVFPGVRRGALAAADRATVSPPAVILVARIVGRQARSKAHFFHALDSDAAGISLLLPSRHRCRSAGEIVTDRPASSCVGLPGARCSASVPLAWFTVGVRLSPPLALQSPRSRSVWYPLAASAIVPGCGCGNYHQAGMVHGVPGRERRVVCDAEEVGSVSERWRFPRVSSPARQIIVALAQPVAKRCRTPSTDFLSRSRTIIGGPGRVRRDLNTDPMCSPWPAAVTAYRNAGRRPHGADARR